MNERQIQKVLANHFSSKRHKLNLSNIYLFNWESDHLSIDNNNKIYEFEIKCSKYDYQNDFKKTEKHIALRKAFDLLSIPNYFYFVCTDGLIDIDVIPEYAGLIYIMKNGLFKYCKVIKKAPILHNEHFTEWENLALKLYYKLK